MFDEFGTALAHRHGAQRAVTGVGVAAQNHSAATAHLLAHISMDNRLVGRYENAAVTLCRGKSENVVVLVYRAAHRAQGVVAVGEHVRQGEFFQSARLGVLDNTHVSYVVRRHRVEFYLQRSALFRSFKGVVRAEHGVSHSALVGVIQLFFGNSLRRQSLCVRYFAVQNVYSGGRSCYSVIHYVLR